MDGLSAAASVIAVVDLALTLSEACQRYYMGVKHAREDIKRVRNSLESLTDILQNIQAVAQDGRHPSLASIPAPLQQCESDLALVNKKLQPSKHFSFQALKWPFNEKEVSKVISDIERHKANLNLALASSTISVLSAATEDLEKFRKEMREAQLDTKRINLLAFFQTVDPSSNHLKARERHEPTSGSWMLKGGGLFGRWKKIPNSFLWLYGKAGCGKSVLCSTIIEHLFEQCELVPTNAIAYYYFDFSDARKQNAQNLLSSLVAQICHQRRDLPEAVENFHHRYHDRRMVPTLPEWLELLAITIEGLGQVYFILDALDECPHSGPAPTRMEVLTALREITEWSNPKIHLLVTSRREVDIGKALDPLLTDGSLDVRESIDEDIKLFIRNDLSSARFQHWPTGITTEVEESLVGRADGMFRWVALQLAELQKLGQKRRILKALKDLPATLDETYRRMLQGIDAQSQDQAITALRWMLYSSRPLKLEEFAELMALNGQESPVLDLEDRFSNPRDSLRFLPGLIAISMGNDETEIVTFSHFTVREYLISAPMSVGSLTYEFKVTSDSGVIAELCMRYLIQVLTVVQPWEWREKEYPLLHYAATQAFSHAGESEPLHETLASLIMEFTSQESPCWKAWNHNLGVYDGFGDLIRMEVRDAEPASPLYYMACLGLESVVKSIATRDGNIDDVIGFYGTPLTAAARFGHEMVVASLLEHGANPNLRSGLDRSPLHAGVLGGNETVLETLLTHGADIKWDRQVGGTTDPDTPMRVAASLNIDKMLRILLERDANRLDEADHKQLFMIAAYNGHKAVMDTIKSSILIRDEWIPEALMKAVMSHSVELLQTLLTDAENLKALDDVASAMIRLIADRGKSYIVDLFLRADVPASPEYRDLLGRTILGVAARNAYNSTLRLLLNSSPVVDGRTLRISIAEPYRGVVKLLLDTEESSPGTLPAVRVQYDIVQTLLAKGANLEVHDKAGNTAIHIAASRRHSHELISILLDAGAKIEARNLALQTPLHLCVEVAGEDEQYTSLLLERGADITAVSAAGNNALHFAASVGSRNPVLLLLNRGADLGLKNARGLTPAGVAEKAGYMAAADTADWMETLKVGPRTDFDVDMVVGVQREESASWIDWPLGQRLEGRKHPMI